MKALITRFLPSLIPGIGAFANPWVLMVVLAAGSVIWFLGYSTGRDKLDDYIAKQAVQSVKMAGKRASVTIRVVTKYVETAGKTETIIKEVEKEVVKYAVINPGSCLDDRWRVLHDAAARGQVPPAGPEAHDPMRSPTTVTGFQRRTEGGRSTGDGYLELRESLSLQEHPGFTARLGETAGSD